MQLNLTPHPSTPPSDGAFKLWANVEYAGSFGATATLNIWFGIGAPMGRFLIPDGAPERTDELWRTTCFEAFIREAGSPAYREWNFAPSGQWAAYDFSSYREGMTNADVIKPPYVRCEDNLTWWTLGATVSLEAGQEWEMGLAAVIEEQDGTKSYWALVHPGEKPDFHSPDCFVARLP
jgi:hypothetical protein